MYTLIILALALALAIAAVIAIIRMTCKSPEKLFECYSHHGKTVWVRKALKGLHRKHCLCFSCTKFHPGSSGNCPIAQALFQACIDNHVVTPVWECHCFREDVYAAERKWNQ